MLQFLSACTLIKQLFVCKNCVVKTSFAVAAVIVNNWIISYFQPARVATIESEPDAQTPGLLFQISPDSRRAALEHLHAREIEAGYEYIMVRVHTERDGVVPALTCISHRRLLYLGRETDSPVEAAFQIAVSKGPTGLENAEYVLKCAHYTRLLFPNFRDEQLEQLERLVISFRNLLSLQLYDTLLWR